MISNTRENNMSGTEKKVAIVTPAHKKIIMLTKIVKVVSPMVNRFWLILFSILIFLVSYFSASFVVGSALVTKAGVIITVFGLLLTLKHNFLFKNSDAILALQETEGASLKSVWEGYAESDHNVQETAERLSDEVYGFGLIILGSLIGAYGDLLPFYKLVPIAVCP